MNGRRLDWYKAKSDKLKGMPSEPADMDMLSEPEHHAWWRGKTREERAASKEALQKQMADAFSRGRPMAAERPKEVADGLTSPRINALLAEAASAARRHEQWFSRGLKRRPKARAKLAKPRA